MNEVGLYRKIYNDDKKELRSHVGKRKSLNLIPRVVKPNVSHFYHTCSESGTTVVTSNHMKSSDMTTI